MNDPILEAFNDRPRTDQERADRDQMRRLEIARKRDAIRARHMPPPIDAPAPDGGPRRGSVRPESANVRADRKPDTGIPDSNMGEADPPPAISPGEPDKPTSAADKPEARGPTGVAGIRPEFAALDTFRDWLVTDLPYDVMVGGITAGLNISEAAADGMVASLSAKLAPLKLGARALTQGAGLPPGSRPFSDDLPGTVGELLQDVAPDYAHASTEFIAYLKRNNTTADDVVQEFSQFLLPFAGYMKGMTAAQGFGGVLEMGAGRAFATATAADFAASATALEPDFGRMVDLLDYLDPDGNINIRMLNWLRDHGGSDNEERLKNGIDGAATGVGFAIGGKLLWETAKLMKGIARQGLESFGQGSSRIRSPRERGMVAFHGTGAEPFTKFDITKIGTGEGAQVYGWGLYFAERPGVAKHYARALSPPEAIINGHRVRLVDLDEAADDLRAALGDSNREIPSSVKYGKDPHGNHWTVLFENDAADIIADAIIDANGSRSGTINRLREKASTESARLMSTFLPESVTSPAAREYGIAADIFEAATFKPSRGGAVMEVHIPDAVRARMLDWDAPLSQQPDNVQRAVIALAKTLPDDAMGSGQGLYRELADRVTDWQEVPPNMVEFLPNEDKALLKSIKELIAERDAIGQSQLKQWVNDKGFSESSTNRYKNLDQQLDALDRKWRHGDPQKRASLMLREHGVPGIKFYDGMSRRRKAGSRNLVTFSDDIVTITKINGKAVTDDLPANPLMAMRNVSESGLRGSVELGGFPNPSLAVVPPDKPLTKMGDISLIANRELADPARADVRVFDADAFSGTIPPRRFRVHKGEADAVVDELASAFEELGERSGPYAIAEKLAKGDMDGLAYDINTPGVRLAFLREMDIPVELPTKPVTSRVFHDLAAPEFAQFVDAARAADTDKAKAALGGLYESAYQEYMGKRLGRDSVPSMRGMGIVSDDGELTFRAVDALREAVDLVDNPRTEVDRYAAEDAINGLFSEHNLREPFEAWWQGKLDRALHSPYFQDGRRKVDYTLENVSDKMTRSNKVRAQEKNLTFGPGEARAATTREFSSVDEMRQAVDKIVDNPTMKAHKDRIDAARDGLVSDTGIIEAFDGGTWDALDAMHRAIGQAAKRKNITMAQARAALRRNGFDGDLTPETLAPFIEYAELIRDAPTEYFEAKVGRAVKLSEFAGAVIPDDAPEDVWRALNDAGVRRIETYTRGDEASHKAAVAKFKDKAFMGTGGTVSLLGVAGAMKTSEEKPDA